MGRAPCCSKIGLNRGPWSIEEDKLLIHYIQTHGEGHWRSLPSKAGLLRCGKSCRLRWVNYLRPGVKRGNFTSDENDTIIRLHSLHGNRWSLIAAEFPGRTDNEIKNHWNTHLRKKAAVQNNILDNNAGNVPSQSTNSLTEPIGDSKSNGEDDERINIRNNVIGYDNFESQELENVGDNGLTEEGIKAEALENGDGTTPTSSGATSYSSSSTVITSTDHQGEVNMNMNVVTDTFFYELDDFIDVDQKMKSSSCCRDIMDDGTKALERLYMEYLQLLNYGAATE